MSAVLKAQDLNAGPVLDALVAEKVMGWTRDSWLGPRLHNPSDHDRDGRSTETTYAVPPYSTDIAAAWDVVERLAADPWRWVSIIRKKPQGWDVLIDRSEKPFDRVTGAADTAPLAICRAALKALDAHP